MRSLLAKSSITVLIMLALGSGLTLAATSSEPGMFLYPIKQTTQKFSGATGNPAKSLTPVIEVPHDDTSQPPSPDADAQVDVVQEPEMPDTVQANATTTTPVPTLVRIVDEITLTTEPATAPDGGSVSIDDAPGPPAVDQLGNNAFMDDGHNDDGQPAESEAGNLDDGQTGKKEKSTDNDNSRSESNDDDESHDDESHNDGEDKDD